MFILGKTPLTYVSMPLANNSCTEPSPDFLKSNRNVKALGPAEQTVHIYEGALEPSFQSRRSSLIEEMLIQTVFKTFEIWDLFGWTPRNSYIKFSVTHTACLNFSGWREEGMSRFTCDRASCFALNRRCLERPFSSKLNSVTGQKQERKCWLWDGGIAKPF